MTRYCTTVQTFYCDRAGCFHSHEVEGTARKAWAEARADGWRTINGRHFCPQHGTPDHTIRGRQGSPDTEIANPAGSV